MCNVAYPTGTSHYKTECYAQQKQVDASSIASFSRVKSYTCLHFSGKGENHIPRIPASCDFNPATTPFCAYYKRQLTVSVSAHPVPSLLVDRICPVIPDMVSFTTSREVIDSLVVEGASSSASANFGNGPISLSDDKNSDDAVFEAKEKPRQKNKTDALSTVQLLPSSTKRGPSHFGDNEPEAPLFAPGPSRRPGIAPIRTYVPWLTKTLVAPPCALHTTFWRATVPCLFFLSTPPSHAHTHTHTHLSSWTFVATGLSGKTVQLVR